MALILAINPGNSHSPTLARLGRELKGCELIGAESCAVAIRAIDERVPDLILLPAASPRGEKDLLARLLKVPGGVPILKLPQPTTADPLALAAEIRVLLTGAPPPVETPTTSPHVLAAATAAVNWIRRRRADWQKEPAIVRRPSPIVDRPSPKIEKPSPVVDRPSSNFDFTADRAALGYDSDLTTDDSAAINDNRSSVTIDDEPSTMDATLDDRRSTIADRRWPIRRIAAAAIVIGAIAGLAIFWPSIRTSLRGMAGPASRSAVTRPVEPAPSPAPAPPAVPSPDSAADAKISGWIAVFAPFEVTVSEATSAVPLDERNRAMLAPGRHRLRFQNRAVGYDETRTVTVKPTETTTINLTPQTTIEVTATQPAEVVIDGQRAGDTPYKGRLTLGTHTVLVKGAAGERQQTIDATSKPVQINVDFSQ